MNKDKFLSAKEMFPQLADTSNPNRFIEFIKTPDLRLFCEKCIEKANKTITLYNNDVAEFVLDLMIRKELLTPSNHQTYVDALLIAAHLFDTYYNPANREEVCELFRARQEFDEIADLDCYEYGPIPEQFREMVWDTIEGQLGDCTPMSKTKPSPNTPQDLFATAVFMASKFNSRLIEDGFLVEITDSNNENLDLEIENVENYLTALKENKKLRDEE